MKHYTKSMALLQAHTVWYQLSMMGYHCDLECGSEGSTPHVDVDVFWNDQNERDLQYRTIQKLWHDGDTIEVHYHTRESGCKGGWITYTCEF